MERSLANIAYDSLRDSSVRASPLPSARRTPSIASSDRRGWEQASLDAQTYLMASRGEELGMLRSRMLDSTVNKAEPGKLQLRAPDEAFIGGAELKLARAEYAELRTMHLLFVEASNKKVADLQEACQLRQREIEALRQEREAERKDRDRWVNELELTRHTLAEKVL